MILPLLNRSSLVLMVHGAGWALGSLVLLHPLLHGVDGQHQPHLQPLLVQRPSVNPSANPSANLSVNPSVRQTSHRFLPPRRGLPERREGGGSF